jgi:uncharacterized protein
MNTETDNWKHPSPRLAVMRSVEALGVTVIAMLIGVLIGLQISATTTIVVFIVIAIAGGVATVLLRRRAKAWGYCERDDDLLVQRGLMVRRLTVVPYGRMQFVDVTAGLAERIFKLASVQLHTAAAATDARIPGLPTSEAERLRDLLAARGSRLSGL